MKKFRSMTPTPPASLRRPRGLLILAVFFAAGTVAGCDEHLERRDKLTLGSGDAVAFNRAVHTIDPWPPGARSTHQTTRADRLEVPVEHYRAGTQKQKATPAVSASGNNSP